MEQIKEPLEYLSSQLNRRGDLAAATRCALLLRYLCEKTRDTTMTLDSLVHLNINRAVGGDKGYMFSGVDSLNALLDERLKQGSHKSNP